MLIGLIGKKQSGKDTFGNLLIERHRFKKRAFADPIKECCKLLFHMTENQLNDPILKETIDIRWNKSPRQIMQIIGTDLFRNHYDIHFWTKSFEQWYQSRKRENIVCTDVRYQNEADCIHRLGGILIYIHRSSYLQEDPHESERLNITNYDYILINDSTLENYQQKIVQLCNCIFSNDKKN